MTNPVKGDWATTVQSDLSELKVNMTFSEISSLSKSHFKNIIKRSCMNSAFQYLMLQKSKLSKGSEIVYNEIETQAYLRPGSQITLSDMRNICMIRLRNINLKCNCPSIYPNRKCIAFQFAIAHLLLYLSGRQKYNFCK